MLLSCTYTIYVIKTIICSLYGDILYIYIYRDKDIILCCYNTTVKIMHLQSISAHVNSYCAETEKSISQFNCSLVPFNVECIYKAKCVFVENSDNKVLGRALASICFTCLDTETFKLNVLRLPLIAAATSTIYNTSVTIVETLYARASMQCFFASTPKPQ